MDLLDWFRGVYPWRKLERLIGQLPWWSKYKLLLADDDEYAEQVRALSGGSAGSRRPTMAEWDPHRELVAELRDGFAQVQAAIANSNRTKGSQAVKPKPVPRPKTATQRADARADYAVHQDIVKQVLPGR